MKSILFIGTQKSGSSREAIKAAEALGYYTVLYTDRSSFLSRREEFPDVHRMVFCDLQDFEALARSIRSLQAIAIEICAIVSFVDPHCHMACRLADGFGVGGFSTEAVRRMEDKLLSREALEGSPYSPGFKRLLASANPSGELLSFGKSILSAEELTGMLPAVVKSPLSAGSKDVLKAETPKKLLRHVRHLYRKYPGVPVLVEEFIEGTQFLIETIVIRQVPHIIAVIEQEITYANERFIVTGYSMCHDLEEGFRRELWASVSDIIRAHGMETGACHLEMRRSHGQWKLIELNPRISGGGMNAFIQHSLGIDLVRETLKLALGGEPELTPAFRKEAFSQYVILDEEGILEKVTGRNAATKSKGVEMVYVKPRKGTHLLPPVSMGNRYAFVIAIGETREEAKANAKAGAGRIRFHLAPCKDE